MCVCVTCESEFVSMCVCVRIGVCVCELVSMCVCVHMPDLRVDAGEAQPLWFYYRAMIASRSLL